MKIEATRAIADDGAEAICLGCAGMRPLDRRVQDTLGVLAAFREVSTPREPLRI